MNTELSLAIVDCHALRQVSADAAAASARTALRHVERIGGRLLDDAEGDGGLAVEAADRAARRRRPARRGATSRSRTGIAVGHLDDDVAELLRRRAGRSRESTVNSRCWLSMRPAGTSTFWRAQRVLDVLRRQAVGGQPRPDRARCAWHSAARRRCARRRRRAGSCSRSLTKRSA